MIQFASQDNAPGISVALTLTALLFTFLLLFMLYLPRPPSRGQHGPGDLMTDRDRLAPVDPQLARRRPAGGGSRRPAACGVEFNGVQRHFGKVTALQGLDLEIDAG